MPTFELRRQTPLTTAEVAALPGGAVPVRGEGETVARARFRALAPDAAVRLAFALGQAARGATLGISGLEQVERSIRVDDDPTETHWQEPADDTQEEPMRTSGDMQGGAAFDLPMGEPTDESPLPAAAMDPTRAEDETAPAADRAGAPSAGALSGQSTARGAAAADPGMVPSEPASVPPVAPVAEVDEAEDEDTAPLLASEPATQEEAVSTPARSGAEMAGTALPVAPASVPLAERDTIGPDDPWAAWDAGDIQGALRALEGAGLDSSGRARVRSMLQSTDPIEVAQGCELARAAGWRSSVQAMRRLLQHADTR
ncbi:MAG: hypothetical protein VX000_16505, partial [Myxococcota bacterium]|nr:hypothetical protein [Myxococcota bacterium]